MKSTQVPSWYVMSAGSMHGDTVVTPDGFRLGRIQDLIIDMVDVRVAFAIVDFGEAALGLREDRLALPFEMLEADDINHRFILRFPRSSLTDSVLVDDPEDSFEPEFAESIVSGYKGSVEWN